jgi:hypothetical protein
LSKHHLLAFRVFDFLWRKNIPIIVDAARLLLSIIKENAVCGIGPEDQGVNMCQLICLTWHLLLDQMVLAVLSKDSMDLLGGVSPPNFFWSTSEPSNFT